jgi:hypothetical protein
MLALVDPALGLALTLLEGLDEIDDEGLWLELGLAEMLALIELDGLTDAEGEGLTLLETDDEGL